jgi:hypothetical protein
MTKAVELRGFDLASLGRKLRRYDMGWDRIGECGKGRENGNEYVLDRLGGSCYSETTQEHFLSAGITRKRV